MTTAHVTHCGLPKGEWRSMLAEAGFAVHAVEPYVRHRPLTALTDGVYPADVARIQAVLASLDDAQRATLNLAEIAGQLYLNHWYVLIAATRDG